jgi:hypothetical protein
MKAFYMNVLLPVLANPHTYTQHIHIHTQTHRWAFDIIVLLAILPFRPVSFSLCMYLYVCLCMCVCMCVSIFLFTSMQKYIHVYMHTSTYMHSLWHAGRKVSEHVWTQGTECVNMSEHRRKSVNMYITCVCMYLIMVYPYSRIEVISAHSSTYQHRRRVPLEWHLYACTHVCKCSCMYASV